MEDFDAWDFPWGVGTPENPQVAEGATKPEPVWVWLNILFG